MLGRWVTTLLVSAAVFMPALRLGLDGSGLSQPAASAAEVRPERPEPPAADRGARGDRNGFRIGADTLGSSAFGEDRPGATGGPSPGHAGDQTRGDEPSRAAALDASGFGSGPCAPFFPSRAPRELLLSFDDGPDLKYTPLVLDELDRWGLKAIFFVTGHRLTGERPEDLARRELVRKIAARGHLVANHTFSHRDVCRFPDEAAAEIDVNAEVLAETTGVRPLLFRAPYGARCKSLDAALTARGLVSVGWNLDPQDWKTTESAEVLSYLEPRLERLAGRGILLLHDTHASSVFALASLLDWIARENRASIAAGREVIVLQSYEVLLPPRQIPRMGLEPVVAAMVKRAPVLSDLFPSFMARP